MITKLSSEMFMSKIPYDTWINITYPKVFYMNNWCYFTQLWYDIIEDNKYNITSAYDLIFNEDDQYFKKVIRKYIKQ